MVAAVQHLLGLGMAVALYVLLLRRGSPRWLAALATAPVLLDAYQLQMEQTVMPDVLFEAPLVAGLAALLWRPRPRLWMVLVGRGPARQHGDDVGARRDPICPRWSTCPSSPGAGGVRCAMPPWSALRSPCP